MAEQDRQASQPHDLDALGNLPLQSTAHNATVLLSTLLLGVLITFLVRRLSRILPSPLRSAVGTIVAGNIPFFHPLFTVLLRYALLFIVTYMTAKYGRPKHSYTVLNALQAGSRVSVTLADGSATKFPIANAEAISAAVLSRLNDISPGKWNVVVQTITTASATPTP